MADSVDGVGVNLVEAFSRLQSLTLSSARVEEFLSELAGLPPRLGGPPLSASVTVRGEHDPFTVASSDEFANRVDEVQYDQGERPVPGGLTYGPRDLRAGAARRHPLA